MFQVLADFGGFFIPESVVLGEQFCAFAQLKLGDVRALGRVKRERG